MLLISGFGHLLFSSCDFSSALATVEVIVLFRMMGEALSPFTSKQLFSRFS
jgi:hypothetical protein